MVVWLLSNNTKKLISHYLDPYQVRVYLSVMVWADGEHVPYLVLPAVRAWDDPMNIEDTPVGASLDHARVEVEGIDEGR